MYVDAHRKGARQYAEVHTSSNFGEESPHRLIQMLMEGFLARINSAKGAITHGDMEAKSIYISKAIGIVGGLNEVLDLEQGGEIAVNLRQLYDYINFRLLQASSENSEDILNEVTVLMKDVKEAWDAIA
ncbi:flagellar export chaperone FliS [Methylomonas sp. MO1]|uniref:Flagellar secretion chaperone FliS n=4 Tax=Methylomonas TaxID=416 RepID=A0A126T6V7_9GAMM|nr:MULTISPECIES: flagellar export chaperone FliS [Methylomonas]AMK77770.1 flagellar protein FliS [Methylomonas denitrificans]MBD9362031.1 flagellar export chaperone FliS [Methylomonas fluvii]MDT4288726.1 flagellar export chaperone FliS [Methylomonas sp. MO1]MDX8126173.1 flagellar export chaperone FliS [Methylomonas sp. OY6]NOV31068.1 flagellar export chaperone FliS [Methylomonas sp. ZR1]